MIPRQNETYDIKFNVSAYKTNLQRDNIEDTAHTNKKFQPMTLYIKNEVALS